ncbi:MAG TPA: ATP-binding protein [Kofleriaceae bacterium]|jgi:signal transduction histidine kinase
MTSEVSVKIFDAYASALERKGLTYDDLVEGTGVTVARLRDRKERIAWAELCAIHANLRRHFTDEEWIEVGRRYMRSPGIRFALSVARLLYSPMDFFRWLNKPREGIGNQVFSCVKPVHREPRANEIELDLLLPDGYERLREFALVSTGNMEELPRALGASRALITMEPLPNGWRFHIQVPTRVPILRRIWRALAWPFTARAAARELRSAHEQLVDKYDELDQARKLLVEHQAGLERTVELRTAELAQARDDLANTVDQLRDAQGARERFFNNVSHEFRTPLSIILLAAADIEQRNGARLDERSRDSLGAVGDSVRKLVRLVEELLLLAVGRERELKLHMEATDLTSVVARLVAAWRPAAEAAGLELAWVMPVRLTARVDPVAIESVATNLVSNAVKYTPRGGRVDIELALEDQGIRLSVLDNGKGIAPDLAPRLFGRFERAYGHERTTTGTGLGLALVKQLVEAHGGSVAAFPRADTGTELRVVLPASLVVREGGALLERPRRSDRFAVEVPEPPELPSGARLVPPGLSAGTVLVTEDDARLGALVARKLAEEYTVFIAYDGAAALEIVREHQPQLLVTDVDMPGMSGIELARRFRETTGDRLAPIIILSAVLDLGTRLAGLDAGATDYVTKPFDPPELLARVRAQFKMRDMALRLHNAEQLSSLGILTAGLAHELRNPANGIVNAFEPLMEMIPAELQAPDTPSGQLFGVMRSCAEQIGSLARQMLGLRNTDIDLDLRPVQLWDLLHRALGLARPALAGVDVRTTIRLDRAILCVAPLIVQVLTNLVENAGHAAGPGGWIEVTGRSEAGTVVIEVGDSGPGVPLGLRERVFEPFFTTKPPGVGTGLGLPLARAIVQRHGGLLEIRESGARSVFVVELPQRAAPSVAATA